MRDDDLDEDETAEEWHPEHDEDLAWRERADAVIPGGASTGSKRPEALYGPGAEGPTHYVAARGCLVTTVGGDELVDCTMALGAVALGYAEPEVTRAAIAAAQRGAVSGLSSVLEPMLAERLCDLIPCAEEVRFLKSGAEGVAAAVRIARTHTGRDRVVCSGYFGWLDWASDAAGVPAGARADVVRVPFDDPDALEQAVREAGDRLAAIVLEPVVERLPSPEWVGLARTLADETGALLVLDEVKTGFRLRPAGYQQLAGVTPDLAVFGKAMANGWPLAAVVGRADVMDAASRTWISSTLAGEATALAAALAVLDWHEKAEVCEGLWAVGEEMQEVVRRAMDLAGVDGVTLGGLAPMWFLRFDEPAREARFLALARRAGVLFKRGAYNFASLAHDEEAIAAIERAASAAFVALRREEERA
jgi:glutamate-1-semialdehyde aminotransferase